METTLCLFLCPKRCHKVPGNIIVAIWQQPSRMDETSFHLFVSVQHGSNIANWLQVMFLSQHNRDALSWFPSLPTGCKSCFLHSTAEMLSRGFHCCDVSATSRKCSKVLQKNRYLGHAHLRNVVEWLQKPHLISMWLIY